MLFTLFTWAKGTLSIVLIYCYLVVVTVHDYRWPYMERTVFYTAVIYATLHIIIMIFQMTIARWMEGTFEFDPEGIGRGK